MPTEAHLISWLEHLWQLFPAQGVLIVGAGNGTSPWIDALQRWNATSVTLIEGDDAQFQHLQCNLHARDGWQLRRQVVAAESGSVSYHQASNLAESGLVEPENLRALWPNLKTRQKSTRQAISLAELLALTEPQANWLLLDCLPAGALLAGAGDALATCDVIVTRCLLPTADTDTFPVPHADMANIDQLLQAQGFKIVAIQTGRHPGVAHALHVRDRTAQLIQLDAALTACTKANAERDALIRSQDQQISDMRRRSEATEQQAVSLRSDISQLQEALQSASLAIEMSRKEAAEAAQLTSRTQTDLSNLATEKTKLQKNASDLQRQVDQALGRLIRLQLSHQQLQREFDMQKAQHDSSMSSGLAENPGTTDQTTCDAQLAPLDPAQIPLGEGWSGNTVNTVIFRHHGLLTAQGIQFTAFYANEATLRFVSRRLSDNDIKTHDLQGEFNLKDAHNSISLGLDKKGFLHVCFDHHASKLRYRRSLKPLDITDWTEDLPMTGLHEDKVTYPTFILPRKNYPLTLLYRDGTYNCGSARLKYYDETNQVWWDKPTPILSGVDQKPWTSNAYWNHPAIGSDGSLHLSFVWRTGLIGEDQLVNNINIGYAWSPDNGHHWYTLQGQPYKLPITPATAETIWATPPGSNLINQCSMALDRYNMPHIAFYGNDADGIPQYQHLWHDGKVWQHRYISKRHASFQLRGGGTLKLPISRPEVLVDKENDVHFIYRGDLTNDRMVVQTMIYPSYSPEQSIIHELWPDDVGCSEPVIDRTLWATDKRLSMLIQHNDQPNGDLDHKIKSASLYLIDKSLKI